MYMSKMWPNPVLFVCHLTICAVKSVIFVFFFGLCDLPDELFSDIIDFCPDSGKMGWCNRWVMCGVCAVCGASVCNGLFHLRAAILGSRTRQYING